jgi:hypothetical protein
LALRAFLGDDDVGRDIRGYCREVSTKICFRAQGPRLCREPGGERDAPEDNRVDLFVELRPTV